MRGVLPVMSVITKTLNSKDRNLEMPVLQADPSTDGHQYQPETGPFLKVLTISFLSLPHLSSHPSQCLSPHPTELHLSCAHLWPCCWPSPCLGRNLIASQVASILIFISFCALARLWIRLSTSGGLIHIPPSIFYFPHMDPIAESRCINFSYCPPSCGGSWVTRRYIHKGNICATRIWVIIFMFTQVTVFHSEYIILHSLYSSGIYIWSEKNMLVIFKFKFNV